MNFLFLNALENMPILLYAVIFFGKIIEVTLSTLRIILVSKGNRKIGTLLAIVEIFLWIFIAGNVITGLQDDIWKAVMYGFGFAVGVYLGSLIEELLAFGKVLIQAILPDDTGDMVAAKLRDNGYGVTTIAGKGRNHDRKILMIYANRKNAKEVVKDIKDIDPDAMIISNESTSLSGGFTKGRLFK